MKYYVEVEGRTYEIEIVGESVTVDGIRVEADLKANHGTPLWHLVLDGRSHTLRARRADERGAWQIEIDDRRHAVLALDQRGRAIRNLTASQRVSGAPFDLRAPMPGLVIAVEVAPNEIVQPGQGLVVIEAMKMENELKAAVAGQVIEVRVGPGQTVDKGDTLVVIEPEGTTREREEESQEQ